MYAQSKCGRFKKIVLVAKIRRSYFVDSCYETFQTDILFDKKKKEGN